MRFWRSLSRLNRVLLVLAAVQVVVLLADRALRRDAFRPERPVSGPRLFLLQPSQVGRLRIAAGGRTTELERRADGWVVANEGASAADEYFVRTALDTLAQVAPGPVVSQNPERHEAYEVAGRFAVEVEVLDAAGAQLARFVLGRSTPDGRGVYLRTPADSRFVMLVQPNVRDAWLRGGNARGAWREKTMFAFDPRRIRAFDIVRGEETIRVERVVPEGLAPSEQDEWRVVRPITAPVERMLGSAMASSFADLKAEAYASDLGEEVDPGLDPPVARVTAILDDGSEQSLEIGAEDGMRRFARRPGHEDVYLIRSFHLHNFLRTAAELTGR